MARKLENKVAVITGGSSGIGLATAKLFREHGAKVVITGRTAATLAQAYEELGAHGDVLTVRADTANPADVARVIEATHEQFGRIDVLFINAGIFKPSPLEATSETQFDETISVNVKGAFFTVQKALPLLSRGASVVFTTSVANETGFPSLSVYAASTAALRSLTRTLAAELIGRGIRVNAVSPGPVATPIFGKAGMTQEAVDEMGKAIVLQVPMKRIADADEIAKAVLFLASDDSSYVLGAELVADGGLTQI